MVTLTAAIVIIGNEILSGRTQDANVRFMAQRLAMRGIHLEEVRIIPDKEGAIVHTVQELAARHTYVFTTGGIGATHDDITARSIATAFGVPCQRHPQAYTMLLEYYGAENLTPVRAKMADMPLGADLLPNPVTTAPGFKYHNVYVLAGVPKIMQGMWQELESQLAQGNPIVSRHIVCPLRESLLAQELEDIQKAYPHLDIGSYPFWDEQGGYGTDLVVKGTDAQGVQAAFEAIEAMVAIRGHTPT